MPTQFCQETSSEVLWSCTALNILLHVVLSVSGRQNMKSSFSLKQYLANTKM
jgi:hypothetical protein